MIHSTTSRCRLGLIALLLTATACVHNNDLQVSKSPAPDDDSDYYPVYESFTRNVQIYVDFETRFHLTSTFLSPEFRQAYAKRYQRMFESPQPALQEASDKTGFFVTIFSPAPQTLDLEDEGLWSIILKSPAGESKPVLVRRLDNKDRWEPFFVNVNKWTREYLVLFDAPSNETSERLVAKKSINLVFANADAKVTLQW